MAAGTVVGTVVGIVHGTDGAGVTHGVPATTVTDLVGVVDTTAAEVGTVVEEDSTVPQVVDVIILEEVAMVEASVWVLAVLLSGLDVSEVMEAVITEEEIAATEVLLGLTEIAHALGAAIEVRSVHVAVDSPVVHEVVDSPVVHEEEDSLAARVAVAEEDS